MVVQLSIEHAREIEQMLSAMQDEMYRGWPAVSARLGYIRGLILHARRDAEAAADGALVREMVVGDAVHLRVRHYPQTERRKQENYEVSVEYLRDLPAGATIDGTARYTGDLTGFPSATRELALLDFTKLADVWARKLDAEKIERENRARAAEQQQRPAAWSVTSEAEARAALNAVREQARAHEQGETPGSTAAEVTRELRSLLADFRDATDEGTRADILGDALYALSKALPAGLVGVSDLRRATLELWAMQDDTRPVEDDDDADDDDADDDARPAPPANPQDAFHDEYMDMPDSIRRALMGVLADRSADERLKIHASLVRASVEGADALLRTWDDLATELHGGTGVKMWQESELEARTRVLRPHLETVLREAEGVRKLREQLTKLEAAGESNATILSAMGLALHAVLRPDDAYISEKDVRDAEADPAVYVPLSLLERAFNFTQGALGFVTYANEHMAEQDRTKMDLPVQGAEILHDVMRVVVRVRQRRAQKGERHADESK